MSETEGRKKMYVDDCPGCDHWRELDYVGTFRGYDVYRCWSCGMVRLVKRDEDEGEAEA